MVNQVSLFLQNFLIKLQITVTTFPLAFLPVVLLACSIEKAKNLIRVPSQNSNKQLNNKF